MHRRRPSRTTADAPPSRPDARATWSPVARARRSGACWRRAASFLLVVAWLLGAASPTPAIAAGIPKVSGPITDEAGVLDGAARQRAEAAIQTLVDATGVQLFAVLVDTTGGLTISDFVDEVRAANSFGRSDALLAVALTDRTYQLYLDEGLGLDTAQVDGIATRDIEPSLRSGDYGQAVVGAADGVRAALAGTSVPSTGPVATLAPGGGQSAPGEPATGSVLGVALGLVGLIVVLRVVARGRLGARTPEERDISTGDLAREANRLLVAIDD